jgi:Flp pilus assembly pilin Flp
MEALLYLFIALVLVAGGAVLWEKFGAKATAEANAVKTAADAVKSDVEKL